MKDEPRWLLTIEEAADALHMSASYVKGKIRSKELPIRKLGTRTRIERHALETFIANQPTVPNPVPLGTNGPIQPKVVENYLIEKTIGVRR